MHYMHVCAYAYIYVCIYACIYVYTYVRMHERLACMLMVLQSEHKSREM